MGKDFILGKMAESMMVNKLFTGHIFCTGEYVDDKKHGKGMYFWTDGRKFDGYWANGKQSGKGKYILADGTIRIGLWENGKRVKWIEEISSSGQKIKIQEDLSPKKKNRSRDEGISSEKS